MSAEDRELLLTQLRLRANELAEQGEVSMRGGGGSMHRRVFIRGEMSMQ